MSVYSNDCRSSPGVSACSGGGVYRTDNSKIQSGGINGYIDDYQVAASSAVNVVQKSAQPRIAQIHRFGTQPPGPCAGAPHDLASCPAVPSYLDKSSRTHDSCDALVALREASSTLGLTETLIGPIRIPCVSSEGLEYTGSKMENLTGVPNTINTTAADVNTKPKSNTTTTITTTDAAAYAVATTLFGNFSITTSHAPIQGACSPSQIGGILPPGIAATMLPSPSITGSLLHPQVHQFTSMPKLTEVNPVANLSSSGLTQQTAAPTIKVTGNLNKVTYETKSHTITIPVKRSEQGPIEVCKEVHKYPIGAITTTVERKSYIGLEQNKSSTPSGTKKKHKSIRKSQRKHGDHYTSQLSLASGVSGVSKISGISGASGGTCASTGSTGQSVSSGRRSPMPRSLTSSQTSINDSRSDQVPALRSRPALSSAIAQMRQAMESRSISDMTSERSSVSDAASVFSDTSSIFSNLSDLSGYEDEYMKIKRLVSDVAQPSGALKKMVIKGSHKPLAQPKPQPSEEQEKAIRDLQAQKEDLEIQLHRMAIQVQNSVREKELYQQQLELMQTKITETNQKQYFEVLKQRAALEGQLEMIKQELENSVYEKSQVVIKLNQALKDSQSNQAHAQKAKQEENYMLERLSKMEGDYKSLKRKLEEMKEELEKSYKTQERTEEEYKVMADKNLQLQESIDQKVSKESQITADNKSLSARILELQKDVDIERQFKIKSESNIRKLNSDLETTTKSRSWYQEQLQTAQSARTELQQQLLELRAKQTPISQERDALDTEVKTLKLEAEEGRARLVREKASLLSHLEALQADMAEREAAVAQIEKERGMDSKLLEERRQKLERDRQRLHNMRLNLSDAERVIDDQRIDLKKKMSLLMRYEAELKELRTADAVSQEILCERDVTIQNQTQSIGQMEALLKKTHDEIKSKNSLITSLSEEKLKVETDLAASYAEKKEVDEGIAKFKEDMSKLTSSFYRMKHDLAAKDRQIEAQKREAEESKQQKDELNMKIQEQEAKIINDEEKKNLKILIETMKLDEKKTLEGKGKIVEELNLLQQNLRMIEIEKKGLSDAVHLREEQIQNLQSNVENYRDSVMKKDEESFVIHEKYSGIEKNYTEICKNYETVKNENIALNQETEAYIELEKSMKREVSEMKENVYKERKLKQSLEKKIEIIGVTNLQEKAKWENQMITTEKSHLEEKSSLENEKLDLEKEVNKLSLEIQQMPKVKSNDTCNEVKMNGAALEIDKLKMEKESFLAHIDQVNDKFTKDSAAFEERIISYTKEIKVLKDEKLRMEKKVDGINTALKQSNGAKSTVDAEIISLKVNLQEILKEKEQLKERISGLKSQEEKVLELEKSIKTREKEMDNHKESVLGLKSQISKINQEKLNLSTQINTLTTENDQLKKYKDEEMSAKLSNGKKSRERSPDKGKGSRISDQNKEYMTLGKKLAEAEAKIVEITNNNETLDMSSKNIKKESLMMKAKTKDYESLLNKSQEMECSLKDLEVVSNQLKSKNEEISSENEKFKRMNSENYSKLKEFEEKFKEKEICCLNIEAKASEYCKHISSLEGEKREFVVQMQHLETRTEELKQKIINLVTKSTNQDNELHQMNTKVQELTERLCKKEEKITRAQLELHLSQEERDQWAAKYQSLRDYIPERDTSTQPAVQLENTSYSSTQQQPSIENLQENGSSSHATVNSSADVSHSINDLHLFLSPANKVSAVDNGAQFERTMSDLQRQVGLTSEALQNKETQIQDLVRQVTSLKLKGNEEQNINTEGNNKAEPIVEYNITTILELRNEMIKINNMIDTRGNLCKCSDVGTISKNIMKKIEEIDKNSGASEVDRNNLDIIDAKFHESNEVRIQMDEGNSSDNSEGKSKEENASQITVSKEVQNLLCQIESFKSQLSKNETVLKERQVTLESSAAEFREKQRRYESNVRLLTRKLKEHMKGRKAAEKSMQEEAQQNQRHMDEERKRYELLKKRLVQAEGCTEAANGEVRRVQEDATELRAALHNSREEAEKHYHQIIILQKEQGRVQELNKSIECLKMEKSSLESSLYEKEEEISELLEEMEICRETANMIKSEQAYANAAQQEEKKSQEELNQQLQESTESYQKLEEQMTLILSQHESSHHHRIHLSEQMDKLKETRDEQFVKIKDLQQELQKKASEREHEQSRTDALSNQKDTALQEINGKINVLQEHIKVLEASVSVGQQQLVAGRTEAEIREAAHKSTVVSLQQSIARTQAEAASQVEQLTQVHREKVSYQNQVTELRSTLHSALCQLRTLTEAQEASAVQASSLDAEMGALPSPSPLDLDALEKLMKRSTLQPLPQIRPLTQLETCLTSLKEEVAQLQTHVHNKKVQLKEGSDLDLEDAISSEDLKCISAVESDPLQAPNHIEPLTMIDSKPLSQPSQTPQNLTQSSNTRNSSTSQRSNPTPNVMQPPNSRAMPITQPSQSPKNTVGVAGCKATSTLPPTSPIKQNPSGARKTSASPSRKTSASPSRISSASPSRQSLGSPKRSQSPQSKPSGPQQRTLSPQRRSGGAAGGNPGSSPQSKQSPQRITRTPGRGKEHPVPPSAASASGNRGQKNARPPKGKSGPPKTQIV